MAVHRKTVLVALATLVAGVLITSCGAAETGASRAADGVYVTQGGPGAKPEQRPSRFNPDGTGEIWVTDITWENWGEATAVGHGIVDPEGEAGAPLPTATITLSGTQFRDGKRHYTHYEVSAPDMEPAEGDL